ncbi:1-phosphofructokinase family hexose kinase [Liquorilactobacillus satsumensis]|uniref:1-phosphofructokinase family hexose kinase n=1 Tax=Liquorilactobacillus satsumensis TaxID=259059 RepID=UPI001E2C8AA7|nr:1-phosphofructokinase family hexose kinase [Liquorilactobacillus satsumensis]MCC7667190.1 tagatose-6-phosphate kinase [Liquorilactobacillus satsumensis]
MILTITTNPSLDIIYRTEEFTIGATNREISHQKVVGGKGINAARVASILFGSEANKVIAAGFAGITNFSILEKELKQYGLIDKFIQTPGETRFCYQIYDKRNKKTELNELGIPVPYKSFNLFLQQLDHLKNLTAISINGSIAPGLPKNAYSTLIKKLRSIAPNAKIILDTSGSALCSTLEGSSQPDIIKPNNDELSDFLGYKVTEDPTSALYALQDKRLKKIPTVVASLGATGAVVKVHLKNPSFYFVKTHSLSAINTQGAGDSTVAGMLYAIDQGFNDLQVIKYGMAAGMANVIEQKTGYVQSKNVISYVNDKSKISIIKLKSPDELVY